LDLCRNVFGEGVYPDVFMTNLYYGGTGIAGSEFPSFFIRFPVHSSDRSMPLKFLFFFLNLGNELPLVLERGKQLFIGWFCSVILYK
jgi:hypothetical protein